MARMPRLVVPGYPHHVTQRGNRRMKTFFSAADYQVYLDLICEVKEEIGVDIWAYCLMPNHTHLVVVPQEPDGLSRLFRYVHRHYTRRINFREKWKGHLWQERFHSFVMDENYLLATVRYVELNPVRAALCIRPEEWEWSSARAHLLRKDDGVVRVQPLLDRVDDWIRYLSTSTEITGAELLEIRKHSRTGRPVGCESFIETMELLTKRRLKKRKPGPKPVIK